MYIVMYLAAVSANMPQTANKSCKKMHYQYDLNCIRCSLIIKP